MGRSPAADGCRPVEIPLSDGGPSVAGSVLVEGRVHRRAGPWTGAVHALLDHLDAVGFDGAPKVVGFDGQGREVLTWVDGQAPACPWPTWMTDDEALVGVAGLLRRFHDAVAGFAPPRGADWRRWVGAPGGPIIRHGDVWPANVVFRDGRPVALIDWEFAQPGTRLEDLASLARHWVPLIGEDRARADGWPVPLDRGRRLRLLCDGYGAARADRAALLDTVRATSWNGYLSHRAWGRAGVPGFAEMWAAGSGPVILGDLDWLDRARPELQQAVTAG